MPLHRVIFIIFLVGIIGEGNPQSVNPATPSTDSPDSCLPEIAANVLWDPIRSRIVSHPCSSVHRRLQGGMVKRACIGTLWSAIDFSECTLSGDTKAFFLLWFPLLAGEDEVHNSTDLILNDLLSLLSIDELSNHTEVTISLESTRRKLTSPSYTSVLVLLSFPQMTTPSNVTKQTLIVAIPLLRRAERIGGILLFSPLDTKQGQRGFFVTTSCVCQETLLVFSGHCIGINPVPPCQCFQETCQCNQPEFVGDGQFCTHDLDQDSYPVVPLFSCDNNTSNFSYCIPDNCPNIRNPSQMLIACEVSPSFDGCPMIRGTRLNITWANTLRGETDTQRCPDAQGVASRLCSQTGQWEEEIVNMCMSYEVDSAFTAAEGIFALDNSTSLQNRLIMTTDVISGIRTFTSKNSFPLLPMDLISTNQVLDGTISLLEDTLSSSENTTGASSFGTGIEGLILLQDVLDVFNDLLSDINLEGWLELAEFGDGIPKLLDNVERYSLYQSRTIDEDDSTRRLLKRDNVAISSKGISPNKTSPVKFPESLEDLPEGISLNYIPAQIELPPTLFQARSKLTRKRRVPTSSFILRNMEAAMPRTTTEGETVGNIASMIISTQVNERGSKNPELANDPVKLMFQFDKIENVTNYRCAYWKFSDPVGNGSWAFDGVELTSMASNNDGLMIVNCSATHLTSFAILVDVAGVHEKSEIDATELRVLGIVSYIGCSISVLFLFLTIIFFLAQGRDLLVKVHYFVHLNLSITLCLGYIVFISAGETAVEIKAVCVTVAAILHYLFLSSFCWMLCEGIMVYLLLVIVFSKLSRNIWFFLSIGYALPVLPVIVSLSILHDDYGVTDQEGNLTFCWLSTENGLIWGFTGPMLVIVAINFIFLALALISLYKTVKKSRSRRTVQEKISKSDYKAVSKPSNKENLILFKKLLIAVLVLLPVLGLTWVLGLFTVNRNTTVFSWIFSILNSLQGLFIFFFHVIRNEKVWESPLAVKVRSIISCRLKSPVETSRTDFESVTGTMKGSGVLSTKSILLSDHSSTVKDPTHQSEECLNCKNTSNISEI